MKHNKSSMAIVGLGHVGLPTLVYFNLAEYDVVGVDTDTDLLSKLREGHSEIREPGITPEVCRMLNVQNDLPDVDTYYVCIDIEQDNGVYEIEKLTKIIREINSFGGEKTVIIKSTIDNTSIDSLRAELHTCQNILLLFSPEFLREGHAIEDIHNNPNYFGVMMKGDSYAKKVPKFISQNMYDCKTLTMLKVANNTWRAAKVSFGNLLMAICDSEHVDYNEVYQLFIADKLNTSKAYLKGGAPFGGYCLPKETAVLSKYEEKFGTSLLRNVLEINSRMTEFWVKKIISHQPSRVVFESLSFKSSVSDCRNSPMMSIRDGLIEQGVEVLLLDDELKVEHLLKSDLLVSNSPDEYMNTHCMVMRIAGV